MADEIVQGEKPEDALSPQGIETTIDTTPPAGQRRVSPQQELFPEVEVIDDTPARDRGHTRPEGEPKTTEEDLKNYSDFKKRVDELTYRYHDQRRVAESREREAAAAADHLKEMMQENRRLKEMASLAGGAFKNAAEHSATSRLDAATRAYQQAYEAGDPVKMVEANKEIASAQYHLEEAKRYEAPSFPKEEQTQGVNAPQPHPQEQALLAMAQTKTRAWEQANPWWGSPGNDMMKVVGRSIHEMLVRQEGILPHTDEYYRRIDQGLREVFPQYSWAEREQQKSNGRAAPVVAPAGRAAPAGQSPGKVRLTESQVRLASRLGLTPQQYAMQILKDAGDLNAR